MPLRFVAPAGAPIRARDLARWLGRLGRRDAADALTREIRSRFGVRHAAATATGRAGMTLLLRAMRALAPGERDEVIVPGYTCYSVAASIVRAGLRPRPVDIDPATLDYDPAALDRAPLERTLAIVATNLYGLPSDLPALAARARAAGAMLIDDAAQAMGATVGGRASGTWGEAGLFSFDKGKNVSAIDGGIVVTGSDDLADALQVELQNVDGPSASERAISTAKVFVYSALLAPRAYWIPQRIPQLGLGRTEFTTKIALERMDPGLAALARVMLDRLDAFTAARVANAHALLDRLQGSTAVRTVRPLAGATAVYLRLPLLVENAAERDPLIARLAAAGIGATASYPRALVDVEPLREWLAPGTADTPGARRVASRIVTLPTHPYVTAADVERMARVLRELPVTSATTRVAEVAR